MKGPGVLTGPPRWALLAVGMIILVSHVCVLPSHHHDETTASQAEEAMHAASCEGLPSAPTPCPILAVGSALTMPMSAVVVPAWCGQRLPTPSLKLPPLFLLHASLLI